MVYRKQPFVQRTNRNHGNYLVSTRSI